MDHAVARATLARLRSLLRVPSREERWWQSLRRPERVTLLCQPELDEALQSTSWGRFPPAQRQRLLEAAQRLAKWGNALCHALDSPASEHGKERPC
jgi:hypothetical protein